MNVLFTIGYEGTDIDRFTSTLRAAGVEALVDVRALALSRKKGFSKKALAGRMAHEGIGYHHLIELGDPKSGRQAAKAGLYAEFRRIYGEHVIGNRAQAALEVVAGIAAERTTCLMCFERDPLTCHRTIVGEKLQARGITMFHLYGDSPARYVNFASKLPGRHTGQGAAAA